ncbi:MAG: hypothetical protein AAGD04_14295 [Pseudomonadota bacterium]
MQQDGYRALSRDKGESFVASVWLENDGDLGAQEIRGAQGVPEPFLSVRRKSEVARAADLCSKPREAPLVIVTTRAEIGTELGFMPSREACVVLGPADLRKTGSLALYPEDNKWRVTSALGASGKRPWTPHADAKALRDVEAVFAEVPMIIGTPRSKAHLNAGLR